MAQIFENPDRAFGGICIPDRLEDAWERLPKLYRIWGDIPIRSVVDTRCTFIMLFLQV